MNADISDRDAVATRLAQLDTPALRGVYRALREFARSQDATESDSRFEEGCIRSLGSRSLRRRLSQGERWVYGALVHAEAVLVDKTGMLTSKHMAGRRALAEIVFGTRDARIRVAA